MKIFLVTRTDENLEYEEYLDMVVVSESKESAERFSKEFCKYGEWSAEEIKPMGSERLITGDYMQG